MSFDNLLVNQVNGKLKKVKMEVLLECQAAGVFDFSLT